MRISEITPEYLPAVSIFKPSAPDAAVRYRIPVALERRAQESGHRRLILDEQNGRYCGDVCAFIAGLFGKSRGYAGFIGDGTRTTNVLPLSSELFQQRISPPWARTMP